MGGLSKIIMTLFLALALLQPAPPARAKGAPFGKVDCIDTHNHLFGRRGRPGNVRYEWSRTASEAVQVMDLAGIRKVLIMPPPFADDHLGASERIAEIAPHLEKFGSRFAIMGGGGTLNPMIMDAVQAGRTSAEIKARFEKEAHKLVGLGIVGFGEFAAEHFSLNHDHHYISAPPDHPLFLLLADLAAKYDLPIDLHMEAVPARMRKPERLTSGNNPDYIEANIPAFERLLRHNRKARIIWSHLGWCNTGERTPELAERLFAAHPNLYMNIKISPRDCTPSGSPVDFASWTLKPGWLELIRRRSDRLLIGADQFYDTTGRLLQRAGGRRREGGQGQGSKGPGLRSGPKTSVGPISLWPTMRFLSLLPPDLAEKIGILNAQRVFKLE